MKQRVEELEQLHSSASSAITTRSTLLTDSQNLVAKYEYTLHTVNKQLTDLRENSLLMKHKDIDINLVSRFSEHRRHFQVLTLSTRLSIFVSVCLFVLL